MSNLEFHPEQAVGEKLLQMDKQELLQFVSRLCLHLKAEIGSRAYHGGIFPENICADEKGGFAIGPARMEKWTGQELEFVAPELYWHGEAGPAADVYSLALLVYYGLNEGRLPFETATASGQLARMSGKALPAPKAAGKRLGEVLEKATSFQAGDRYQNPEELQIMLESCMDNKFLGGSSGAEAIFRKEDDQLSDLERMMVDIIENSPVDDEEEESPEESLEGLSIEEVAGLEKPDYTPPEKEDLNAMVEEFFGLSGGEGESAPAPEEDGEEIRVYQPSKDKKDRQPIPILTEEKNPELAPVVLQQQPSFERTRRRGQEEQEAEPDPAQEVRKRRSRRPLTVVLLLCLLLLAGALGVNAYWNRGVRPTQINPTPDPQKLYETHPSILPTTEATQDPVVISIPTEAPQQPRYSVVASDLSWTAARAACEEQGGHLVVISSQEELKEVTALAESMGLTRLWIGCHWDNGDLVWENGEETDFFNWAENEPSTWDYYDNVAEDYIMIYRDGDQWLYNDNRDDPAGDYPEYYSGTMGYVVEFER